MNKSIQWLCVTCVLTIPIISPAQDWVARYDGPSNDDDRAHAIAVDNAGNVYVTGKSLGSGTDYDYATVKYDSLGVEQWVVRYNGPGNSSDGANALVLDNAGNVYVTGRSIGSGTQGDYATVKYNSLGVEQWVARYNGPGNDADEAESIAVDSAGNVYVTGGSVGSGTQSDYATVKYNSLGVEQWVARYNGSDNNSDGAIALVIDNAGNVYITGGSIGSGTWSDYATVKYNSLGIEQWVARYNGPGNYTDRACAAAGDSDGNIYVTGGSAGVYTGTADYATLMYNSDGVQQWVVRYNSPDSGLDVARALALDNSGNICITGTSLGSYYDYLTIKYDPSGTQQWAVRYTSSGAMEDEAYALAIDSESSVYVTGYYYGGNYCTLKYDSSGIQQWVKYYNGPGNGADVAYAIAVDAVGNAYVTGRSRGLGSQDDYATIKYSPLGIAENTGFLINEEEIYLRVYPNPVRHRTEIRWYVSTDNNEQSTLGIFNSAGQLVKDFSNQPSTIHDCTSVTWSGDDNYGNKLPSGVYFLQLQAGDYNATEKLLLIR